MFLFLDYMIKMMKVNELEIAINYKGQTDRQTDRQTD